MLERRVEIIKTLRATPIVLRVLVDGVDQGGLRRRPGPGEWAIIEVISHLADTEERALGPVRRMLAEGNPQLEPFDQKPWPSSTLSRPDLPAGVGRSRSAAPPASGGCGGECPSGH
jgi:hypothetical protein